MSVLAVNAMVVDGRSLHVVPSAILLGEDSTIGVDCGPRLAQLSSWAPCTKGVGKHCGASTGKLDGCDKAAVECCAPGFPAREGW